jgi:hypothetical protein
MSTKSCVPCGAPPALVLLLAVAVVSGEVRVQRHGVVAVVLSRRRKRGGRGR